MNRFDDRLDAERYADDPAFGVGLGEGTPGDQDSAWIPERLMARIVALDRAYELHLLPLIGEHEQVHFNPQQAESLAGEVAYVLERVDDPCSWTMVAGSQSSSAAVPVRQRGHV